MKANRKIQLGACPECDADIPFQKAPFLGQKKRCQKCLSDLEVISLYPIELDWVYEYDEDEDEVDYNDDFK